MPRAYPAPGCGAIAGWRQARHLSGPLLAATFLAVWGTAAGATPANTTMTKAEGPSKARPALHTEISFEAEGLASTDAGALHEESFHEDVFRRLRLVTALLPNTTALSLQMPAVDRVANCRPVSCHAVTDLTAGLKIADIEVNVDPHEFYVTQAKLRIVRGSMDTEFASTFGCLNSPDVMHSAHVKGPWADFTTVTMNSMPSAILKADSQLTFLMGGDYKICYSDDGTFSPGHADVVPPVLSVAGIYDAGVYCDGRDSCLYNREQHCYVMKEAYNNIANSYSAPTSCIVDYSTEGAGYTGTLGKGSWSSEWRTSYDGDTGIVTQVQEETCSTDPAPFISEPRFFDPDAAHSHRRLALPATRNDLDTTYNAYTVAVCYCPNLDSCDAATDFRQRVGILHYYATKVCSHGYGARACTPDFAGVTPQHRFAVRIECPTNACSSVGISRMKIVAQRAENDLPKWDPASGCRTAVHGRNSIGYPILPDDAPNLDVHSTHGGTRQDYKLWNFKNGTTDPLTAGFLFKMGHSDHELRNSHGGETYCVCYCDDACDIAANWFKSGQLRFAPFRMVSAALNTSNLSEQLFIEFVNQPGVVAFYRPPIDYNVMGLQEGGMLKLVEDNAMVMNDALCATAEYDRLLVNESSGLSASTAPILYSGRKPDADGTRLVFNQGTVGNTIAVQKAGTVAICYCARVVENICANNQWVLAVRTTIRGPIADQEFMFSTHVTFRFEYSGYGLTNNDKIRIIASSSSCDANNNDPNGAFTGTNLKTQCPDPCTEVGEAEDVINGNLDQLVLSDSNYQCDEHNADCNNNDIKSVRRVDEHWTELEFEKPPFLQRGDMIILGDNIECHPSDLTCTAEQLSSLKGRFEYADVDNKGVNAPHEYIAGHRVEPKEDKKVWLPVGWPAPGPRFAVDYANNKRGRWTRHTKAVTKQEVMGTRERRNMKVCWKYGGALGKFTAQVGTLTLMDPNPMTNCIISLMSTIKGQKAPLVLSFQTASAQTGQRYSAVQGATQLKLFFTRTLAIDVMFVDDAYIENNAGEDEIGEARQYICGKLFKEVWSNDEELGFPMPKGCYYRSYGMTRELNILFERKGGLRAGFDYHIVLQGMALEEANGGGEYAQIFTMDDVDLKPYEAIERGLARLSETPQDPAYGSNGVRFLYPDGFKIVGGTGANMYEFEGGSPLIMEFKGDIEGGGITKNSILRIFLWPLMQWDVATLCTAECMPHDQVSAPCGSIQACQGDAVVANFQNNLLRIILPAEMTTMDSQVSHTIRISELQIPKGGFFPTRIAAQISKPDDTKPHYAISIGDFLLKAPDEGQTVGKLVSVHGDGNNRPFRGDRSNVLYAKIILATTLFAAIQTGDAKMMLTLPAGYECVRPADVEDGGSPWAAEETLSVFGDDIPQGRGTPDEGSGSRGWSVASNTCTFTLRQNAVIFAGSSLYIRISVNNPATALKRELADNRWQISLRSKGYHQWFVDFPTVVFGAVEENFGGSAAVLGRIEEASMTPSNFAASLDQYRVEESRMRIFFQTEQATGIEGGVQVVAPEGFVFFPSACVAGDLDESYYATHESTRTRRLPGITSCNYHATPFNHAKIGLTGSLLANTFYGFRIDVRAPIDYLPAQQEQWQIFTVSRKGYRVDGTPYTLRLSDYTLDLGANVTNRSFGLYQYQLNTPAETRARVQVSRMVPFFYAPPPDRFALVTVRPLRVPVWCKTTLRIVAPMGYIWALGLSEFNFSLPNVTAPLPGGLPMASGNTLVWPERVEYLKEETYGFEAPVIIPRLEPTRSINAFIIEFGFDRADLAGRIAASVVDVDVVRALVNAQVDYMTNVESKENNLIFQVETRTVIPLGGVLTIVGPDGFLIPSACVLEEAPGMRGSTYETAAANPVMPIGLECTAQTHVGFNVTLVLRVVTTPLMPALYRFQTSARNPDRIIPNPPSDETPCGFDMCWTFSSLHVNTTTTCTSSSTTSTTTSTTSTTISTITTTTTTTVTTPATSDINEGVIDAPVSVPSFPINRRMVEAILADLTPLQRESTGRDDRPMHLNPLVFAFKLSRAAAFAAYLTLRAPLGTIFREDCLADIEWRGFKVFGELAELPAMYAPWDAGTKIISCRGEGPDATLLLDPGPSNGLQQELLYPFRLNILANPASPPAYNLWTIEYAGESANPFVGFPLWTFSRTSITTVSTAKSSPLSGAIWMRNPTTFTFRPRNTVQGAGMIIKVTAPENFQIVQDNDECSIIMQPLTDNGGGPDDPPATNFTAPPSSLWGQADVGCTVDTATRRVMTARVLAEGRRLIAGHNYQMTIFVYNPTLFDADRRYVWELQTEAAPTDDAPYFRDLSRIPGYAVNERLKTFVHRNEDPETKVSFRNGREPVPGLYIEMRFPMKLVVNDTITLEAPRGFLLEAPNPPSPGIAGTCNKLMWEPPTDRNLYLPNSRIICKGGKLSITVAEADAPFPELRQIKFRIDTVNPSKTPHIMLNHWSCTHRSPTGIVLSSDALPGWDIVPQLENVVILLTGREKAASSMSKMEFSFTPISDADELSIVAKQPAGFDFTGAQASILGHEVIMTSVERIRVRCSMYAEIRIMVGLEKFKLGQLGGPTIWDLVTRLNNGEQMDERLDFRGGGPSERSFRLPGRLSVISQRLASTYQQDSVAYPVAALWDARMNEMALVQFFFKVTQQGNKGDKIRLRAPPYMFYESEFELRDIVAGVPVATKHYSIVHGEIVEVIDGPLWVNVEYQVSASVMTPGVPNPEDAMWSIEIIDDLDPLPLNTNDALTKAFLLVEQLSVRVVAGRTPPMAEIDAEIIVKPKATRPTELIVVAPPQFNFTTDCLVSGGLNNEVQSCYRTGNVANRAAAVIVCREGGLLAPPEDVRIRIIAPAATLGDSSWFVSARNRATGQVLGWGEDPQGVEVSQMRDAGVVYPGIPQVSGTMVFRFSTNVKVDEGGKLRVGYPRSITVNCEGDFLSKIALKGDVRCNNNPRKGYFDLEMPRPLPPGQQAFAVSATPPSAVEQENIFYLMVLDPHARVVDAAMYIPGMDILHGISVNALPIIWAGSEANRLSSVTLGFELTAELPENDPPWVYELCITVPQDFSQEVQRNTHVELSGVQLPTRKDSPFLDFSSPSRLRILLDPQETKVLEPGKYRIKFPARVPARMPANNVWLLTLCSNPELHGVAGCNGPDSPAAMVTMPFPGFDLGETHPSSALTPTAGMAHNRRGRITAWLAALLLVIAGCQHR